MRWIWMVLAGWLLVGGTNAVRSAEPGAEGAPFSGQWEVRWCEGARSDEDCGGFWVNLVQSGHRVCGEYDGAKVNLTQIDEGGRVAGTADGDWARLKVRSLRNHALVEVQVQRKGPDLHWKRGETIEPGNSDISIIADEEVLQPGRPAPLRAPEACR